MPVSTTSQNLNPIAGRAMTGRCGAYSTARIVMIPTVQGTYWPLDHGFPRSYRDRLGGNCCRLGA